MTKRAYILILVGVVLAAGLFALLRPYRDPVIYEGHHLLLNQLRVVDPHPGCDYTHYHAKNGESVTATDFAVVHDESDCGFGPVK